MTSSDITLMTTHRYRLLLVAFMTPMTNNGNANRPKAILETILPSFVERRFDMKTSR